MAQAFLVFALWFSCFAYCSLAVHMAYYLWPVAFCLLPQWHALLPQRAWGCPQSDRPLEPGAARSVRALGGNRPQTRPGRACVRGAGRRGGGEENMYIISCANMCIYIYTCLHAYSYIDYSSCRSINCNHIYIPTHIHICIYTYTHTYVSCIDDENDVHV